MIKLASYYSVKRQKDGKRPKLVKDKTINTFEDFKNWFENIIVYKWKQGIKTSIHDKSLGHSIVYRLCSENNTKIIDEKCFYLYLNYCKSIYEYLDVDQQSAINDLLVIFKYLDKYFMLNRTKDSLFSCAQNISKDLNWFPLYYRKVVV